MRVMGIDLGIAKVAFSVWEDEILTETAAQSTDFLTYRHQQLFYLSDYLMCQIAHLKPELVIIEDILIGNNRKYSIKLAQSMGAVLSMLGELDCNEGMTPFGVIPVNVSTWKKEVLGHGHADKEAIRNYLLERDSAYAALCGSDQDRFDAACIGYYGVILSQRADRLRGPSFTQVE